MAYQDLALRNVAGEIAVTYNDNNLRNSIVPDPTSGPRVMATATAKSGANAEVYRVQSVSQAMQDFDSRSELATLIASTRNSNPTVPMSVARVGGKPFHFILKRDIDSSYEQEPLITITPAFIQEEDTDRGLRSSLQVYKLILLPYVEGSLVRQRVIIVASDRKEARQIIAYDSERLLQINGDAAFDVEIDLPLGEILITPDAFDTSAISLVDGSVTLDQLRSLSDLKAFKYKTLPKLSDGKVALFDKINFVQVVDGSYKALDDVALDPAFDFESIDGSDGDYIDHVERYAANESVYEKLEFENFSYLYCERCYADLNPVELSDSMSLYEQLNWHKDSLGYMWKYVFNGRPYMFMFGRPDPFTDSLVQDYTVTENNKDVDLAFTPGHKELGDLLNLVEFNIHSVAGAPSISVESFVNRKGLIECHIEADLNTVNPLVVKTPFANLTFDAQFLSGGEDFVFRNRPSLVGTSDALSSHLLANDANLDPFVMTHFDLTGELIPEGVMNRLVTFIESLNGTTDSDATLVAANVEVREISFLHQAAQAAYVASTNYNQVVAIVPTTPPPASLNGVSQWAGNPGTYQVNTNGELEITANGTGVLGTKLLAGATTYRDGAAFGGVILTNGDSLPNKTPYGIDDQDEALDSRGNPIDLGKHAVVVGAYGLVPKAESLFPGNTGKPRGRITASSFGSAGPLIAAILNRLAPGTEPIGPVLGRIPGFSPQQRTPRKVLNDLAALRVCMIDQNGVISSIYTSALRTSDYSKVSSIMSANAIVSQIRTLSEPIIGQAFTDAQIASLQTRLDGAMRLMVQQNYAQDIRLNLTASQLDRINGVLRCSVVFVPPLSLEAIQIDLTLEAPSA